MLYLLLLWTETGVGLCCGDVGLATSLPPLALLGDLVPLSLEIVRFEREWLRGVGGVEDELRVEVDLAALPLDPLSLEELSLWKLALERRRKSLKKGMKCGENGAESI